MGIEPFDVVDSNHVSTHSSNKKDLYKNTLGCREVGACENICGPLKNHSYSFCNILHFEDIHYSCWESQIEK